MKNDEYRSLTKDYNQKIADRLNAMWKKQGVKREAWIERLGGRLEGYGVRSDVVVRFT